MLQGRRYTLTKKNKKTRKHTLQTHLSNTPCKHTLQTHLTNTPCKHTLQTHKTHHKKLNSQPKGIKTAHHPPFFLTIPKPSPEISPEISPSPPRATSNHPEAIPMPPKYRPNTTQIPLKYHSNTTQIPLKYRPNTASKPYFSFSALSFFTLPIFTHLGRSRRLKMCGVTPFPPTNALHPPGGHPLFFLAEYALPLLSTACHS